MNKKEAKNTLNNLEQIAGLSIETFSKDVVAYLKEKELKCSPSDAIRHALKQQLGDYADERLLAVVDISYLMYNRFMKIVSVLKD